MNLDAGILDPPDYATHYEHDDVPEQLGDHFTLSAEDDAKITRASRPDIVTRAIAGDAEAMAEMRRLHVTMWQRDGGVR